MAIHVVHSVDIAAPPDVVWQRFLRVDEWPRWFPSLSTVLRSREGAFALDEELLLTLGMAGYDAKVTVRVSESTASLVRWRGKSFGVSGDHAFFVTASATGTRFTSDEKFTGMPLLLLPRRYIAALQTEVEAGLDRFRILVNSHLGS